MTVTIGVIGVGMIGQDHIRRLTHVLAGSQVVAVSDVDPARTKEVAESLPVPARVHATGEELIADPDVQAVIVASWGPTHEEYVLASLWAGKPVFCEKPLATTEEACSRIIDAEVEVGRRLVQVGFMRRYDAAYRAMKQVVDSGEIGAPLLVHSRHRNPSVPEHYTREMAITDTAVHDFDTVRWLLGEELVSATVLTPRRSRHGGDLQDPLMMLFETESGALVDVETSVNIRYGYDIRGEIVGEDGTVALAETSPVLVRRGGTVAGRVPEDWRERFIRAYDVELQQWVDALAAGRGATGPGSWDGYAAAVVSDAAVEALRSGTKVAITLRDKPDLYAKEG
jgi:myo-inositol 2-dehydrogenase/D-chiro-inositol 1-dehydrogenase